MFKRTVKKKAIKKYFPVHFCLKCNKGGKVVFSYPFKVYKAPSQLFLTATLKDEDPEGRSGLFCIDLCAFYPVVKGRH